MRLLRGNRRLLIPACAAPRPNCRHPRKERSDALFSRRRSPRTGPTFRKSYWATPQTGQCDGDEERMLRNYAFWRESQYSEYCTLSHLVEFGFAHCRLSKSNVRKKVLYIIQMRVHCGSRKSLLATCRRAPFTGDGSLRNQTAFRWTRSRQWRKNFPFVSLSQNLPPTAVEARFATKCVNSQNGKWSDVMFVGILERRPPMLKQVIASLLRHSAELRRQSAHLSRKSDVLVKRSQALAEHGTRTRVQLGSVPGDVHVALAQGFCFMGSLVS